MLKADLWLLNKMENFINLAGTNTWRNRKNGFVVCRLHYTADPDKCSSEWKADARKGLSDDAWEQEMEINFFRMAGRRAFSGFSYEANVRDLEPVKDKIIYRGWDFGYIHPACVMLQIDDKDRICILKALMGTELTIDKFAEYCKEFYTGFEFEDFCDPAGAQRSDKNDKTSVQILNVLGIYPKYKASAIKDGINLIRLKLKLRSDNNSGLLIDKSNQVMIDGFVGGYVLEEKKDEPKKEGYFEHIFDALRYIVINLFKINKNEDDYKQKLQRYYSKSGRPLAYYKQF